MWGFQPMPPPPPPPVGSYGHDLGAFRAALFGGMINGRPFLPQLQSYNASLSFLQQQGTAGAFPYGPGSGTPHAYNPGWGIPEPGGRPLSFGQPAPPPPAGEPAPNQALPLPSQSEQEDAFATLPPPSPLPSLNYFMVTGTQLTQAGLAAAAAAPPMEGIDELPDGDAEFAATTPPAAVIKDQDLQDPAVPFAVGDMVVLHGDASDEAQHGPLELDTVPGSLPGRVVEIGRGVGEAELSTPVVVRAADGGTWTYEVRDLTLAPDPHRTGKARDSTDYAEAAAQGKARASIDAQKGAAETVETLAFSRAAGSLRKHQQEVCPGDVGAASAAGDRKQSYVYSSDKVLEVKREIEKAQNTPRKAAVVNKTSFL